MTPASARPPAAALLDLAGAPIDSVVCFAIGGVAHALDVAVVREVVSVDKLVAVPRTPPAIMGVFALRGAVVALVDTRILLALAGPPSAPPAGAAALPALVIARGHRPLCGLTIDRVIGVMKLADAELAPALPGREPPRGVRLILDEHDDPIIVLDAATLVHSLERLRC